MGSSRGATLSGMNATLRTALGWVAAVLLNVGALLVVVGLLVPRTGGGDGRARVGEPVVAGVDGAVAS